MSGVQIIIPHIEEKYAPAEKVQAKFELVGDYVSVSCGEIAPSGGYKEITGTMVGIEQFINAAKLLGSEFAHQELRRGEKCPARLTTDAADHPATPTNTGMEQ